MGKFLPGLFTMLGPVANLVNKESARVWGEPEKQAFVFSADANSCGLDAVLLQNHDWKMQHVAFSSRTLPDAEKNVFNCFGC